VETIRLSREEHAELMLKAWKAKYPHSRIYRNGSVYSGGSSVNFYYVDGPPQQEAYEFFQQFSTTSFDSYTDMMSYTPFEFQGKSYRGGYSHVFARREYSGNPIGDRVRALLQEHGLSSPDDKLPDGTWVHAQAECDIAGTDLSHVCREPLRSVMSFAELKRRLTVGTYISATFFAVDGSVARTRIACPIITKQTNAIQIAHEPNATKGSWLYWPAKRHVEIHSETEFSVYRDDGSTVGRYEILDGVAAAGLAA
jgi:hypothetical protein